MKRISKGSEKAVSEGEVTSERWLRLSQKVAAVLNEKDIVSQARDKKSESIQWIETESELRQALGTGQPRRKMPRKSSSRGVMELLKSLIFLLKPGVGQKADR